jgi:hypothetical protein
MRAIQVKSKTILEIKAVTGRRMFRKVRKFLVFSVQLDVPIYFIPEYIYPETAHLARINFVTEKYLNEHFLIWPGLDEAGWFTITPKAIPLPEMY